MSQDYKATLQQVRDTLAAGDTQQAFQLLHPLLRYPAEEVQDRATLVEALEVFARVAQEIAGEQFASEVENVVKQPEDAAAFYQLGYALIDERLSDIAATILVHAHKLEPTNALYLSELCSALEDMRGYGIAQRFLQNATAVLEQDFLCCYLLAFTSIMSGDLETARQTLPRLQHRQGDNNDHRFLTQRIEGMLLRADALTGVSPLDTRDLRGWHFVITGSYLLHLSPYGFDEGMHGRYAFIQDTSLLCMEGILRMKAMLEEMKLSVPRVFQLPEHGSAILAHTVARVLDLPLVPWPEEGSSEAGLIVAYDLDLLDGSVLATLLDHRPGQILWSHASCWTHSLPFAADLTTYLYQTNRSPWGPQWGVQPDTGQIYDTEPDTRSVEALADDLSSHTPGEEELADLPELLKLVRATASLTDEGGSSLLCASGPRQKQWSGSPVSSNAFL